MSNNHDLGNRKKSVQAENSLKTRTNPIYAMNANA